MLREAVQIVGVMVVLAVSLLPVAAKTADSKPITIVAFGDSLTAGYGLKARDAFPVQLQMALQAKGHKVEITNAGVSGDTTADGLARLDWSLEPKPDAVILELGANDMLRGIDPREPRANLDKILGQLKSKNIDVLIAGMKSPGNWGADYVKKFDAMFPDLATQYGYALYPFFLEGVFSNGEAINQSLVQSDGLHPTAKGVAEIVKRILPDAEKLVERVAQSKTVGK